MSWKNSVFANDSFDKQPLRIVVTVLNLHFFCNASFYKAFKIVLDRISKDDSAKEEPLQRYNFPFRSSPDAASLLLYLRSRGGKKNSGSQAISEWFRSLCAWCGHNYGHARLKGRRRSGAEAKIIVCLLRETDWDRMTMSCDMEETDREDRRIQFRRGGKKNKYYRKRVK